MLKVEKKLIQFKELDAEGAGSAVFRYIRRGRPR